MASIPRKIDDHRRVVIPPEICELLNISPGKDFLELSVDGDCIILSKSTDHCTICNEKFARLIDYKGSKICYGCSLKKILNALRLD